MIQPIANGERGDSVRDKLNTLVEQVSNGLVYKPDDEVRTTVTLAGDADLIIPVLSGVTYLAKFALTFVAGGTADKPSFNFSLPTVVGTVSWSTVHQAAGNIDVFYQNTGANATLVPITIILTESGVNFFQGWIKFTTSAAGHIFLEWNNFSGTGSSRLKEGSWLSIDFAQKMSS